jgi:hypothetical protein
MMKGFSMPVPVEYRTLPIEIDDFLRLRAAMGDRDRKQQLLLLHDDFGAGQEDHIAVMITGCADPFYTVRRAVETGKTPTAKPCWLVHPAGLDDDGGPLHEFPAVVDVANFLASGEARLCKRSFMTGWIEPGRVVGGAMPEMKRELAPPEAARGGRGRYLPMLGDRAGE